MSREQQDNKLLNELEMTRDIIARANNSLFGSDAYFFTILESGVADQYHLARPIEALKESLAEKDAEITRLRAESARWQDLLDANVSELGKRIKALTEDNERLRAELAASKDMIARLERTIDVETYTKLHREMHGTDPKLNETDAEITRL
jgi:predicted RNase H-like nuclease (RuvC/YqgF family)